MYYHLHANCKIVEGTARSAIYDLNSGKVYSINNTAKDLLLYYEQNPFFGRMKEMEATHTQFFDTLTKKGVGGFYFNKPNDSALQYPKKQPLSLDFVWFELTEQCNNHCIHCYTDSSPESTTPPLSHERRLSLLHEISVAGCKAIQFIGGEPLLEPNWREIIEAAVSEKFTLIELFTNATLLTQKDIDFLATNHIHVATTLYAAQADIHDKITQTPGSFTKTVQAIEKMIERRISLRIASVLMKTNETESEAIVKLIQSFGLEAQPPDIIRPIGRGNNSELQPDPQYIPSIKPPFWLTESDFIRSLTYNTCLAGKIAITTKGNIIPCIFARNNWLGNVKSTPLHTILSNEKLRNCWHTNKDKVTKCKDCEYRYACPDCRPCSQSSDSANNWLAAPPNCHYDPYSGQWQHKD